MIKVGSIVEFIGTNGLIVDDALLPELNKPYTVRCLIHIFGKTWLKLEEFTVISIALNKKDAYMNIKMFKEIQFPDDLEQQIKEMVEQPYELELLT